MRTRIKFCGLTREADVDLAVSLGVDMIGLVFAGRSARRLEPARAAQLRARIPHTTRVVALVMDAPGEEVDRILAIVKPDLLQFHGNESEAFCRSFTLPYLKAVPLGGMSREQAASRLQGWSSATALLLDGHAAGEAGGSGQRLDWADLPKAGSRHIMLAGGLSPDNVAEAIRLAAPWGVDVSSGIESAPGIKAAEAMRAFVSAVHSADASVQKVSTKPTSS